MSIQGFKINGDEPVHYDYDFLDNKPIFYATYGETNIDGQTSFEAIVAAHNDGKLVQCIYNGNDEYKNLTYWLGSISSDFIEFYSFGQPNEFNPRAYQPSKLYILSLNAAIEPNAWGKTTYEIESSVAVVADDAEYTIIQSQYNQGKAVYCKHEGHYYYLIKQQSNTFYFVSIDSDGTHWRTCNSANTWNDSIGNVLENKYFQFLIDYSNPLNITVSPGQDTSYNAVKTAYSNGKTVFADISVQNNITIIGHLSYVSGEKVVFTGAITDNNYNIKIEGRVNNSWSGSLEPIVQKPDELPQPIGAEASIGTSIFKYATQDHVHALPSALVDALIMLASNIVYTNETVAGDCYYALASALGINPLTRPDDLTITPFPGNGVIIVDPPHISPVTQ